MTAFDIFSYVCIPVLVVSLGCVMTSPHFPIGPTRKLLVLGGGFVFVVFVLISFGFGETSELMVANQQIACMLFGVVLLAMILYRPARTNMLRQKGSIYGTFQLAVLFLSGISFAGMGGWDFVRDFLQERQHAEGFVVSRGTKDEGQRYKFERYYIGLNGREYKATMEAYQTPRNGLSRVEIGAGSGIVFRIKPLSPPVDGRSIPYLDPQPAR